MSRYAVPAEDRQARWIQAVEWHALRCGEGGLTPAQRTAWLLWWQDDENRRIYAACARLHADALRIENANALTGRGIVHGAGVLGAGAPQPRRVMLGAAVTFLVVGWVLLAGPPTRLAAPARRTAASPVGATYETGPGQTRRVLLRDGSIIILGAETAVNVSLTSRRRAITLDRGEAWFHVVHRSHWPFRVRAGKGTITDLGTAFVVDRDSGRVEVTVTQGRVEVALARSSDGAQWASLRVPPIRLYRGERLSYGQGGDRIVRSVSPRLALAWTRGELAFSDESLRDVVENIDRYLESPVEVSPAAGRLHLTTLVMSRRISAWLQGLSHVLPVTITRTDAAICIRLRTTHETHLSNSCIER